MGWQDYEPKDIIRVHPRNFKNGLDGLQDLTILFQGANLRLDVDFDSGEWCFITKYLSEEDFKILKSFILPV